jgi:hypothetical protein
MFDEAASRRSLKITTVLGIQLSQNRDWHNRQHISAYLVCVWEEFLWTTDIWLVSAWPEVVDLLVPICDTVDYFGLPARQDMHVIIHHITFITIICFFCQMILLLSGIQLLLNHQDGLLLTMLKIISTSNKIQDLFQSF